MSKKKPAIRAKVCPTCDAPHQRGEGEITERVARTVRLSAIVHTLQVLREQIVHQLQHERRLRPPLPRRTVGTMLLRLDSEAGKVADAINDLLEGGSTLDS